MHQSHFTANQALWNKLYQVYLNIRNYHPWLRYKEIAFDEVVADASEILYNEQSENGLLKAVNLIASAFNDSVTAISTNNKHITYTLPYEPVKTETTTDNILILTIDDYRTFSHWQLMRRQLPELVKKITEASGLVFDFRNFTPGAAETAQWAVMLPFWGEQGLFGAVIDEPIYCPAIRSVMQHGLSNAAVEDYYTGFVTKETIAIAPAKNGIRKPVVIILNKDSLIQKEYIALQKAGRAVIISTDELSLAELIPMVKLVLTEHHSLAIRTGELVYPDGTTGFKEDYLVKEDVVNFALEQVRSFKPIEQKYTPLPAAPVFRKEPGFTEEIFPRLGLRMLAVFRFKAILSTFLIGKKRFSPEFDQLLEDFIPRMATCQNEEEYGLICYGLVGTLRDGHGHAFSPVEEAIFGSGILPFQADLFNGELYVTAIQTELTEIQPGDKIIAINGQNIIELKEKLRPAAQTYNRRITDKRLANLLRSGLEGSWTHLQLERSSQKFEAKLEYRKDYPSFPKTTREKLKTYEDVTYFDICQYEQHETEELKEVLSGVQKAVFDLRGYPGDLTRLMENFIPVRPMKLSSPGIAMTLTPLNYTQEESRHSRCYDSTYMDEEKLAAEPFYKFPYVVLWDERNGSFAEWLAERLWSASSKAISVGTPTAGADGAVTHFELPGGVEICFSGGGATSDDFEYSLIPDIIVEPTLTGVLSGKDEVLETALELLKDL